VDNDPVEIQIDPAKMMPDDWVNMVKNNPQALSTAPSRMQDSSDVVFAAVNSDGMALQYASKRLQDDDWLVKTAVTQNLYALEYASDRIKEKYTQMLEEKFPLKLKGGGIAMDFLEWLKNLLGLSSNKKISSDHVDNDPVEIQIDPVDNNNYNTEEDNNDSNIDYWKNKVRENPETLRDAPFIIKDDWSIIMEAVKKYPKALNFASDRIQKTIDDAILDVEKKS